MTTIAFRDGVMASDSCVSAGHLHLTSMPKILRTSAGALIGFSGDADVREVLTMLDGVQSPAELPTKQQIANCRTDFELLIAFAPRQVFYVGADNQDGNYIGFVVPSNMPFAAVGSGSKLALGALAAGKSAREAVKIACAFDCYSKPPIHSVSFARKRRSKIKFKPK